MFKAYLESILHSYFEIWNSIISDPTHYIPTIVFFISLPIFFIISRTRVGRTKIMFLINLPGTIIHESLHFLVGVIFMGKPKSFSLIPKKSENGWLLGEVSFTNLNSFNVIPIALAPALAPFILFLTGPFLFSFINSLESGVLWKSTALSFIFISIINNCIPSRIDFQAIFKKPLSILFYALFGFGLWYYYDQIMNLTR